MYIGSVFRAARRYAEASSQRWVILSAAHGIVEPETVIRPYDQKLDFVGEALARWARLAADGILQRCRRDESIEILAGEAYALPLANALKVEHRWPILRPLVGLGTGKRLSALRRMGDELSRRQEQGEGGRS